MSICKEAGIASPPPRLCPSRYHGLLTVTLANSKQIPHKSPYTAIIVQSSAHCQGSLSPMPTPPNPL